MAFQESVEDDQRLSRVGILFCCAVSLAVFVIALRVLPVSRTLPGQLEQVGRAVNPSASPAVRSLTPTPAPSAPVVPASAAAAQPSVAPAVPATPTPHASALPTPAASSPTPTAAPKTQAYTVQPGDTLYSIARREGTSPQALAAVNGLPADTLVKTGQTLRVP